MWSHESWWEGDSHSPGSPGCAPVCTHLVALSLLCCQGTLLAPAPLTSYHYLPGPSQQSCSPASHSPACIVAGVSHFPWEENLHLFWFNFWRLLVACSFILSRSLWMAALSSRVSTGTPSPPTALVSLSNAIQSYQVDYNLDHLFFFFL